MLEFDGKDTFFGLVDGVELWLGRFSLAELVCIRGPLGLAVERDEGFTPCKLSQVKAALRQVSCVTET